jgi:hypothetical protein
MQFPSPGTAETIFYRYTGPGAQNVVTLPTPISCNITHLFTSSGFNIYTLIAYFEEIKVGL